MKNHIIAALFGCAAFFGANAADSDPILLTVDGKPVHVSEFEYLYNKNNSQQEQAMSLDDYLKMFIDYKLKVVDAEHAGIPQSPEFIAEFTKFRNELAAPYLRDASVEDKLVDESYGHHLEDVYVSHIMMSPDDPAAPQKLDSIRNEIIAGRADFAEMARQFSIDRGSNYRGGEMGYVVPDRFPWAFEKMAYDTPVGQISPVFNSGFGYHIVRPERRSAAGGEVNAAHILLTTRDKSPEQIEAVKAKIDSIYTELKKGADFAEMAKKFSEDPGSARNGGELGWFTRGMMVAEFDSTAFALADGEMSTPFTTAFGYHIIKRKDHRLSSKEDMRKSIIEKMARDSRASEPEKAYTDAAMAKRKAKLEAKGLDQVKAMMQKSASGCDSTCLANLAGSNIVVASFNNGKVTAAEIAANFIPAEPENVQACDAAFRAAAEQALRSAVMEAERTDLLNNNADYRNLVNEYRDGILLYEISNRNVWDRASKDTEGLAKFFNEHKAAYNWDQPKFKSYVIFATNDSILNLATEYAATLNANVPADFSRDMRKKFGRDVKVERVIAAKGENVITDYLAFGAKKPVLESNNRWASYAAFNGRILDAPEEAVDVRGAAVTDYQTLLDKEWVEGLHKKYKVKVNDKVFKSLKKNSK